jgi:hypothetical protein
LDLLGEFAGELVLDPPFARRGRPLGEHQRQLVAVQQGIEVHGADAP